MSQPPLISMFNHDYSSFIVLRMMRGYVTFVYSIHIHKANVISELGARVAKTS